MSNCRLDCRKLSKTYIDGKRTVNVLTDLNLQVDPGRTVAIMGRSGSGKSTLLHCLGGLDTPTQGEVWVEGRSLYQMREFERAKFRNQYLGFIYQFHHLLPEFSALENVIMPQWIGKVPREQAAQHAESLLTEVGLLERLQHKPAELSGGERQRVAIARALANNPKVILADEPTGNLDDATAEQVFALLIQLTRHYQTSLIIATHDETLANRMDHLYHLEQGALHRVK